MRGWTIPSITLLGDLKKRLLGEKNWTLKFLQVRWKDCCRDTRLWYSARDAWTPLLHQWGPQSDTCEILLSSLPSCFPFLLLPQPPIFLLSCFSPDSEISCTAGHRHGKMRQPIHFCQRRTSEEGPDQTTRWCSWPGKVSHSPEQLLLWLTSCPVYWEHQQTVFPPPLLSSLFFVFCLKQENDSHFWLRTEQQN